jgi:nucleotide-binding universal stress UspA family protein
MAGTKIVVGYDGSQSSRAALGWALGAASGRGLSVLIVHALRQPIGTLAGLASYVKPAEDSFRAGAERMLAEAEHASRLEQPSVDLASCLVEGPPVPVLLEQLADAEMGVVGGHGLSTFAELLLGSTSFQLVTYAPCPIVAVRSRDYSATGPEAGRVVVGVDGLEDSADAVGFAFEEASLRGTGLTAVHAWETPFYDLPARGIPAPDRRFFDDVERSELCVLSEALAGWREQYPEVDVRQALVRGEPAAALVDASAGAELVVVGSRGRGGFRSLLLGSVSHAVLQHARSAVAVVRPHRP